MYGGVWLVHVHDIMSLEDMYIHVHTQFFYLNNFLLQF